VRPIGARSDELALAAILLVRSLTGRKEARVISVINLTEGKLSDEEAQGAIRGINRQIAEDFGPYWSPRPLRRARASGRRSPRGPARATSARKTKITP